MSLAGKTAVVTGSGGGLGHVIARMFLSRGANVVLCDISAPRLAAATAQHGADPRVLVQRVDVTDEASVQALVAAATERFGGVDVVVNNAGVMDRFDPAGACDTALWERVLAVNLTGPFLVTKHAVQAMQQQRRGRGGLIVNIGSNASQHGLCAGVAYSASKHGVVALTRNTAGFYGREGICCVALLLGAMEETNIVESFGAGVNAEGMRLMKEQCPGYEPGKTNIDPDHVARYVGFLSEDGMAAGVNGSCIVLNNNWPAA